MERLPRRHAVSWQRPFGQAAPVNVAGEAVALRPGLVPLRAVGSIGPHAGPGVRGIEEAFAQELAVVTAGVGDVPAADQPELLSPGATIRHGWEIMLGSQRKACLGMRQLEEAVLDVLFEAQRNGEYPGVVEISRRAGLFGGRGDTSKDEPGSMAHSIA